MNDLSLSAKLLYFLVDRLFVQVFFLFPLFSFFFIGFFCSFIFVFFLLFLFFINFFLPKIQWPKLEEKYSLVEFRGRLS